MEIRIEGLSVRLDGQEIVDALNLHAADGEIVGLIGPNGSGKSTVLRCLYRALKPSGGIVRVGGDDAHQLSLRAAAQRLAALTQESAADFDFTVAELVALGRSPHQHGNQPLSTAERDLCHAAMAQVDVLHLADRGVLSLSGGERQRALIARALVQQPRVLVLDEPTNHLDLSHQIQVLSYLRGTGLTTVLVLHDLNLAAATCDRLAVLRAGRIAAVGPPAEVLTSELIKDVFGVDVIVTSHPLTGDPQVLFTLGAAREFPDDEIPSQLPRQGEPT